MLADEHGFLLVAPQGREDLSSPGDHHWNDCRTALSNPDVDSQLDDVGFITALIDAMQTRYGIDKKRVYATGASNGGMMSYRLAFEATARFAAIGAVIANLPDPSECEEPDLPISMLIMNGTADPLMPYNGGCVANNSCQRGTVTSIANTLSFWIEHNGTSKTPVIKEFPDINKRDSSTVTSYTYSGGASGTEVVLYRIEGGGHTVPGPDAQSIAQSIAVGPKNRDISGANEIWEFFEKHSR